MPDAPITLLVEELRDLARALPEDVRLPALERLVARGRPGERGTGPANPLRYHLLGLAPPERIPVAALTQASYAGKAPPAGSYWLRADPVTLRADMVRVFTVASGYQDFDEQEQAEIDRVVRAAFAHEGLEAPGEATGPWCLALESPPGFDFPPLDEVLGRDVADALPENPAAARWKRLMTEIQVDLHHAEVNAQRRGRGLAEINSVWFWGGGPMPETVSCAGGHTVISDHPVSCGLAIASGRAPHRQADLARLELPADSSVLVDWVIHSNDVLDEARRLDETVQLLFDLGHRRIELVDGGGFSWTHGSRSAWRFWKRSMPLPLAIGQESRA